MQQKDYLTKLLGFQGFYVMGKEIEKEGDIEKAFPYLERTEEKYICSSCNREVFSKHSSCNAGSKAFVCLLGIKLLLREREGKSKVL